jgi:hypothetical protein
LRGYFLEIAGRLTRRKHGTAGLLSGRMKGSYATYTDRGFQASWKRIEASIWRSWRRSCRCQHQISQLYSELRSQGTAAINYSSSTLPNLSKARSCRRLKAGVSQKASLHIRLHLASACLVMSGLSRRVNCTLFPNLFVRVLALGKLHFALRSDRAGINPVAFPSTAATRRLAVNWHHQHQQTAAVEHLNKT